jgi:hypothetical protein
MQKGGRRQKIDCVGSERERSGLKRGGAISEVQAIIGIGEVSKPLYVRQRSSDFCTTLNPTMLLHA